MIDINATLAPYIPPVVPEGQYKILFTVFFTKTKINIFKFYFETYVKPTKEFRGTEFSMVNMG